MDRSSAFLITWDGKFSSNWHTHHRRGLNAVFARLVQILVTVQFPLAKRTPEFSAAETIQVTLPDSGPTKLDSFPATVSRFFRFQWQKKTSEIPFCRLVSFSQTNRNIFSFLRQNKSFHVIPYHSDVLVFIPQILSPVQSRQIFPFPSTAVVLYNFFLPRSYGCDKSGQLINVFPSRISGNRCFSCFNDRIIVRKFLFYRWGFLVCCKSN